MCQFGTYSSVSGTTSSLILCDFSVHLFMILWMILYIDFSGASSSEVCTFCSPGTYSTASGIDVFSFGQTWLCKDIGMPPLYFVSLLLFDRVKELYSCTIDLQSTDSFVLFRSSKFFSLHHRHWRGVFYCCRSVGSSISVVHFSFVVYGASFWSSSFISHWHLCSVTAVCKSTNPESTVIFQLQ